MERTGPTLAVHLDDRGKVTFGRTGSSGHNVVPIGGYREGVRHRRYLQHGANNANGGVPFTCRGRYARYRGDGSMRGQSDRTV